MCNLVMKMDFQFQRWRAEFGPVWFHSTFQAKFCQFKCWIKYGMIESSLQIITDTYILQIYAQIPFKYKINSDAVGGLPGVKASLVVQVVRNVLAMQETRIRSLGRGRSPGEGNGNPLQDSCLGHPRGQRSLVGCSPRGRKESDITERLILVECMSVNKSRLAFNLGESKPQENSQQLSA